MTFVGELYPYQRKTVKRMVRELSLLVAFDMGTGKTPITIAALEELFESEVITEPGIVICLSSLKYQWQKEITKFTGGSTTSLVIDGTQKQRDAQYATAMDWRNSGVDIVIMNFEQGHRRLVPGRGPAARVRGCRRKLKN
jgi:SNF2 family DNA or RNA helicase